MQETVTKERNFFHSDVENKRKAKLLGVSLQRELRLKEKSLLTRAR